MTASYWVLPLLTSLALGVLGLVTIAAAVVLVLSFMPDARRQRAVSSLRRYLGLD